LALVGGRLAAAGPDELAGAPAAWLVVLRRRGTDRLALLVPLDVLPAAVLLRIAVSGIDLDERLARGVVLGGGGLMVHGDARGRVEPPRRPVRDDEPLAAPLRQLLEQLLRRVGVLVAARRQLAGVDALRTERRVEQLLLVQAEVEVALAVLPVEQR